MGTVSLKSFLNGNDVLAVILKIIRKNNYIYNIVDVEYMIDIISCVCVCVCVCVCIYKIVFIHVSV